MNVEKKARILSPPTILLVAAEKLNIIKSNRFLRKKE